MIVSGGTVSTKFKVKRYFEYKFFPNMDRLLARDSIGSAKRTFKPTESGTYHFKLEIDFGNCTVSIVDSNGRLVSEIGETDVYLEAKHKYFFLWEFNNCWASLIWGI